MAKRTRRRWLTVLLLLVLAAGGGVLGLRAVDIDVLALLTSKDNGDAQQATLSATRPWAASMSRPGLPNLHQVSQTLYRGAQPTAEGMKQLKTMGVRTVINLRSMHSDRDEIGRTGLGAESIPMNAWHAEDEDIIRFLQIVSNPDRQPVFVHCQHGSDRTGTMCAVYRIAVQGWSKEQALQEMTEGGFGFHEIWQNLVTYINALDIEKLRKEAGIISKG
ncbi:MAG: tyrosine-protein phosphatase [Planctomycetaceae bacterium]|nr:tyrosine-protein phosphatase [Planctomycetaceae bacterium]